jgi:hypothetical protein
MKRVNCLKCGVRIIPYTYSCIFDEVNRKALGCVRDAMTNTLKINVKKPVLTAMRYEL